MTPGLPFAVESIVHAILQCAIWKVIVWTDIHINIHVCTQRQNCRTQVSHAQSARIPSKYTNPHASGESTRCHGCTDVGIRAFCSNRAQEKSQEVDLTGQTQALKWSWG